MANATNNTTSGDHENHWTATATKSGTYEFSTAGKYVDRNIDLVIPQADLSIDGTPTASIEGTLTVGAKTGTDYVVTSSGDIKCDVTVNVDTKGFTDETKYTDSLNGTANVNGTINAAAATVTGSATVKPNNVTAADGTAKVSATTTSTTAPSSGYYIGVTPATAASTTISQSKSGLTKGILGDLSEISASGTVTGGNGDKRYVTLPTAAAFVTLGAPSTKTTAASPTIAKDAATNVLSGTATTTKPGSGYYVVAKATAPATSNIAVEGTVEIETEGYLGNKNQISVGGGTATAAKTGSAYYIPITSSSLDSTAKAGVTYTENTTVVIPSKGALYIEAGYIPATMITLDQMLDGKTDTAGTANTDIRNGKIAYTVDGEKLTGSMGDATVTSGAISHTLGTPTYNSDTGVFDMNCEITAAAPTVDSAGYIDADTGIKNSSSKTENHTLNKVEVQAKADTNAGKVTPVISNITLPITGKTQITASPSMTITGINKYYMAVNTAKIDATTKVTPSVKTAGYGTANDYSSAGDITVTRGTNASGAYVIPIASGAHSNAVTATASKVNAKATYSTSVAISSDTYSTAGIKTAAPSSVPYITIAPTISTTAGTAKADASATCTVTTAGWLPKDHTATKTATQNTASVDVDTTIGSTRYIEVYSGTYSIA